METQKHMKLQLVRTVHLAKWFKLKELPDSAVAKTFGELVAIASQIVEHYRSDMYHDANWLTKHLKQDPTDPWHKFEFYYAVDNWGTAIGTDPSLVLAFRRDAQYKFTIEHTEDDVWVMHEERIY